MDVPLRNMEVPVIHRWHPAHTLRPLVDPQQARQVLGALNLLIAMSGRQTCLGIILQQARSEVASLLHSEEEARRLRSENAA